MTSNLGIIPLGYRVIIESDERKDRTEGGIYMPEVISEREEMAQVKGTLVAKGPDAWAGKGPDIGERVLFAKYAGYLHTENGVKYRVVNDEDIVGILTGDSK